MMPPLSSNWRITLTRRDGTNVCVDAICETREEAVREAERYYHSRYDDPCDGESHWITRTVQVDRPEITGTPA